jgi:FtsP/CotA-like multicopper oxidase with cupredoxin domain
MKFQIYAIFIALLLIFPLIASSSTCPDSNVISDPQNFVWQPAGVGENAHFTGTLEIREATLEVGGETITTRIYHQPGGVESIPGPTLNMQPGKKYVLRFRNTLDYEPKATEHNIFKDPNVSNLHTHGLHISGETPSDDVTRSFEGGAGGDFVYDIPADHMGGTYWYHAHHHGSTFLQVSAGAFGLIVVDDGNDDLPINVANMVERRMVVAYLDPDVAGIGGDTLISGTLSPTWTVNGKVGGDLCIPPNTWQHWRVLLADRDASQKTVTIGSQCEVALMSRDGVWRTAVPKELPSRSLQLTGASRADLAVRCSGDTTLSVAGTVVANILVDGPADLSDAHPYAPGGEATWTPRRPVYLRDLRGELVSNTETINMGSRTLNGNRYDPHVPTFTIPADAGNGVQQWTLSGASNHPFHLHIYHVQVDGPCDDYEDGEYYDVVSDNCNIRFDLGTSTSTPYNGRAIMHCHILSHEDQGAMGWLNVVGGQMPPTFPAGFDYVEYTADIPVEPDLPSAPTNLSASAGSSGEIYLSWLDNADNEDLFDIERARGDESFAWIDMADADTQGYQDTGLQANTIYRYRIRARNTDGYSLYSNISTATTDPADVATLVRVGSISLSIAREGGRQKRGRAVVVVENDQGGQVSDAVVSGAFSGTFNDVIGASDPTGTNGSTSIDTTDTALGRVTLEFCVTAISHPELTGFMADYGEVCGTFVRNLGEELEETRSRGARFEVP